MKFLPTICAALFLFSPAFAQDGAHTHAQLEASITAIEVELAAGNVERDSIGSRIDALVAEMAILTARVDVGDAELAALSERLTALEALHAEPIPEPDPVPDPPPPDPIPGPIDWINDTLANCDTIWCRPDLAPWDEREAWLIREFTDAEGTYTRSTQGDLTADPVRTTGPRINLVEGQKAIFNDWVSFARDPETGRILFYGGGHGGYAGSDVYQWDPVTDAFELVFEPRRLKFRGLDPTDSQYEIWTPSEGFAGTHTYGTALWHSSGVVLWGKGGPNYVYYDSIGTGRHLFRGTDPGHGSDLKLFDAANLTPGRGDPERWSWGPSIKQVGSGAAPSAIELPDGRVIFIDDEIRLSFYDVASRTMGPKMRATVGGGRVNAPHAVYSAFDDRIYVRTNSGIMRIDYKNLTSELLAFPTQIPVSNTTSGNYRRAWYDRAGLVSAGPKLVIFGGVQRDPEQQGHFYYYDLADADAITWVAADGPDLWSVHGKNWYLGNDVILSLPAHDEPAWLVRLPEPGNSPPPPVEQTAEHILEQPDGTRVTSDDLAELGSLAQDGATITIQGLDVDGEPLAHIQGFGTSANNLTVQGVDAPWLDINAVGSSISDKGLLVFRGSNTTVRDIGLRGATVGDGNGAGLKFELGAGFELIRITVEDSQNGLLSALNDGIEIVRHFDSLRNGGSLGAPGRAHGGYFSGLRVEAYDSRFIAPKQQGHAFKSRAAYTLIASTTLADLDGDGSRLADISDSGIFEMENFVLQKGVNSVNREVIGIGYERRVRDNGAAIIRMNGGVIICDRDRITMIGHPADLPVAVETRDVRVIACPRAEFDLWFSEARGDEWFPDRASSGLEFDADRLPR